MWLGPSIRWRPPDRCSTRSFENSTPARSPARLGCLHRLGRCIEQLEAPVSALEEGPALTTRLNDRAIGSTT